MTWKPWDRMIDVLARALCWVWGHGFLPGTVRCVYCGKDLR